MPSNFYRQPLAKVQVKIIKNIYYSKSRSMPTYKNAPLLNNKTLLSFYIKSRFKVSPVFYLFILGVHVLSYWLVSWLEINVQILIPISLKKLTKLIYLTPYASQTFGILGHFDFNNHNTFCNL